MLGVVLVRHGRAEEHYEVNCGTRTCPPKCGMAWCCAPISTGPKPKANSRCFCPHSLRQTRRYVDFGPVLPRAATSWCTQDVRGRYTSEGEWYPFKYESQDGYDTVEWAAALPYSNGKVGMFGGSYVGATQMLAAIASPPHLAGILPVVTALQLS